MDPAIEQIVSAFEIAQMTPEQIKQELFPDMELAVIKNALAQFSSVYAEQQKQLATKEGGVGQEDITDEEFSQIKRTLKQIALYGESEEVRARCCKYLWEEKKGRNEAKAKIKALQQAPVVNIFTLSKHLEQARRALEVSKQKAIDIVASPTQNPNPEPKAA